MKLSAFRYLMIAYRPLGNWTLEDARKAGHIRELIRYASRNFPVDGGLYSPAAMQRDRERLRELRKIRNL